MSCERNTEKTSRFEGANQDLPIAGDGVMVRFCEVDGWIEMSLVIREDATTTGIRQFLPYVKEWRDRLTVYQGRWIRGGDGHLYETLRLWHRNGKSYKRIAERINKQTAEFLQEYVNFLDEYNRVKHQFRTMGDYHAWQFETGNYPFALHNALDLMRALGVQEPELCAQDAIENLGQGKTAFPPEFPVTKEMVRSQIRQWDKKQSKGWEGPRPGVSWQ